MFTSFWLIPIFVFMHAQGSLKVTLPCVFPNTPSNFLEIEEARNSLLSIYSITTWIQNGTKQFLEIGIRGHYFVWFVSVNPSLQWELTSYNHSITPPAWLHQWPRREQEEGNRLRGLYITNRISRVKTDFVQALLSTLENLSHCRELKSSPGGKEFCPPPPPLKLWMLCNWSFWQLWR